MKNLIRTALSLMLCLVVCSFLSPTALAETIASGTSGDNLNWTLDNEGPLFISGYGDMTSSDGWSEHINEQGATEAAQEAAEQTKDDAETAAESVSQSAAQIETNKQEIGDLKSALDEAIEDFAVPSQDAVDKWLDRHPEAKTTVQDRSLTETKFSNALKLKTPTDYVTPQMYGAKGDGFTDDTDAFNVAQNSGFNVYVPTGNYVLTNFDFSTAITWVFQRAKSGQWFGNEGGAKILTSTSTKITSAPKIYNLCIKYNGDIQDTSLRPVCLKMLSHFCEIHGFWESGWYVGMDFGRYTGGHCDYTKIYDAYCWYNYLCGVRLEGIGTAQVNFISFYDCNIGSNGVNVHDRTIAPDTSRGYGFYIANANAIAINNVDASSNETCSIFIDNSDVSKTTRGLFVGTFYTEHNKYCDIYYKNGPTSSTCRSGNISIEAPYIFHDTSDEFYIGQVYADYPYIPKCVNFWNCPKSEFKAGTSLILDTLTNMFDINVTTDVKEFGFFGKRNTTYRVTLKLLGVTTGNITLQNIILQAFYSNSLLFYSTENQVAILPARTVSVIENTETDVTFDLVMPNSDSPIVYYRALGYGANANVIEGTIEEVTD